MARVLNLFSTTLMSLMSLDRGIGMDDFFSHAPRDFASRSFDPARGSPFHDGGGGQSAEFLPNPSFFSNFEMPFFSFEEEISIHDKNTSKPVHRPRQQQQQQYQNYYGDSDYYYDDDEPPMVLSDFANVSIESGANAFFDQLERMAAQRPLMNDSELRELDRSDFLDARGQPEFSVYRITTDGKTPFDGESESEILYGDDGMPSEVVVYVDGDKGNDDDGEGEMLPSESRLRVSQQHPNHRPGWGRAGAMGRHGQTAGERRSSAHLTPAGSAYGGGGLPDAGGYYLRDNEEVEYDDGPYGVSRSDGHTGNLEYIGGDGDDDDGDVYSPLRRGGYGHDDHHGGYGHDDHHGGYDDIHHGYGHDDHDHGYSPVKKPGPFGKAKKNFKCEYAKETLYVSKTTYKFKKKCYKILKVKCKKKDGVGKKIGYKKICNEFSVTKCRKVFATKFKTKCWLVYKKKCEDIYKTKVDWVYKEKCKTVYEKECSGYGYHKHCHEVPKEICKQVPVKKEKQVKGIKCKKVPDKKCKILRKRKCKCHCKCNCKCKKDVPFFVPKKECKDFPKTVCTQDPINIKKGIPLKACFTIPIKKCVKVPKEVVKHVPKTVKKKVCVSTKAHDHGYGHPEEIHVDHHGGYHDDHHDHGHGGYHRRADHADVSYVDSYDRADHYDGGYVSDDDGGGDTGFGGYGYGAGAATYDDASGYGATYADYSSVRRNAEGSSAEHHSHRVAPMTAAGDGSAGEGAKAASGEAKSGGGGGGGADAYGKSDYGGSGYESSVHYRRAPAEQMHSYQQQQQQPKSGDDLSKLLVPDATAREKERTSPAKTFPDFGGGGGFGGFQF